MRLSSEFPNDNEQLHLGLAWTVADLFAAPSPTPRCVDACALEEACPPLPVRSPCESGIGLRGEALRGELSHEGALGLEELVAVFDAPLSSNALLDVLDGFEDEAGYVVEDLDTLDSEITTEAEDATDEPFRRLVRTLVELAESEGSETAARAVLALLVGPHEALPSTLSEEGRHALSARGFVDERGIPTPPFLANVHAWRAVLCGTSDDLGACGGAMLDEWASDVLAHVLGTPSRATVLRRELRTRGVAAFGLSWAA